MRKASALLTVLLAAALFALPLFAQKAKPIEFVVDQVNDRRSPGPFSELTINLKLPKLQTTEVAASRVILTTAVDDLGQSLIDPDKSEPKLEQNYRASMDYKGWNSVPVATVAVSLKSPGRKAKAVRTVNGEIELFMPAKDPNSVAEVAKFLSSRGKPLAHKALKANGVEITFLNDAQIEADRKRAGEAKRKQLAEYGYEGESLDTAVKEYVDSLYRTDSNGLAVRIKDPQNRIQDLVFVDAAGEVKQVNRQDEDGVTVLSMWSGAAEPDWKLRVSMRTPKNLLRHSFALNNIPLP